MEEYKNIFVVTKNDNINEVKSYNEITNFYSSSLKYIVLVKKSFFKESYLSSYDNGYFYEVLVKNEDNQDCVISYGNFKLRILYYQKNISKRNITHYYFDGFEYEIIDSEGNSIQRKNLAKILDKKPFEKDFRGQDWGICKLSSIIKLMSFIQSFNDLKEVKETFSSYK